MDPEFSRVDLRSPVRTFLRDLSFEQEGIIPQAIVERLQQPTAADGIYVDEALRPTRAEKSGSF